MDTSNVFDHAEQVKFLFNPKLWQCNCDNAKYSSNETAFSTITCQCGHQLTIREYYAFNSRSRDYKMSTINKTVSKDLTAGKKNDKGKYRADLLLDLPRALQAVSSLLTYGADLYAPHNWLEVPEGEERYKAAMMRHILDGAIAAVDPQFGLNHDVAVALNALFVLELRLRREENDGK